MAKVSSDACKYLMPQNLAETLNFKIAASRLKTKSLYQDLKPYTALNTLRFALGLRMALVLYD